MKITDYGLRITNYGLVFFTFLIFNFSFVICAKAQVASGGSFSLEKFVIPGGGGESAGGGFTVTGTAGQNAAGTSTQNSNFFQIGGFWTADRFVPTAARVSIGGKVTTLRGSGIRNVSVTLTDPDGNVRTTVTGSFGAYNFTDVEVGRTYIVRVRAKKYFFSDPTQILTLNDALTDVNFTAGD
jgi:hypothetical protein